MHRGATAPWAAGSSLEICLPSQDSLFEPGQLSTMLLVSQARNACRYQAAPAPSEGLRVGHASWYPISHGVFIPHPCHVTKRDTGLETWPQSSGVPCILGSAGPGILPVLSCLPLGPSQATGIKPILADRTGPKVNSIVQKAVTALQLPQIINAQKIAPRDNHMFRKEIASEHGQVQGLCRQGLSPGDGV